MKDEIFISQGKYANKHVKKFGQDKAKSTHTPMSTSIKLNQDSLGKYIEQTSYKSMNCSVDPKSLTLLQ